MRIEGFFKKGPLEAAYVVATVILYEVSITQLVEFLIDTGASRTTISDRDAIRLGIDYSKLKRLRDGTLGIGGRVETFFAEHPELVFVTPEGTHRVERLDRIYVLRHKRLDESIRTIPSILGRDVLNKYALLYDKKKERVSITDEKIQLQ